MIEFYVCCKKRKAQSRVNRLVLLWILMLSLCSVHNANAQANKILSAKTNAAKCSFVDQESFIENIGQYGETMDGHPGMGKILFGYEGLPMPILFTSKGLIHLHRKINRISKEEEERLEKQGVPEEEIERKKTIIDKVISMEWAGANANPEIITEDKTDAYHTYGLLMGKAYGYRKITYKNLYPGIDLVYNFTNDNKAGFEFSFLLKPGADIRLVKMKFNGNIRSIRKNNKGELIIRSDIDKISISIPVSYYGDQLSSVRTNEITSNYQIQNNEVSFSLPQHYDRSKPIVIDPFVSGTGNLLGLNTGKAKDVDFDYSGNVYVTGGGSQPTTHSLAKYNAAGVLQWTFNGTLAIPSWTFGTYYGGWMVEKPTGHVYLGQGFNYPTGFRVIRVNTTGLYDNYITTANGNFTEAWKMFWSCNYGSPEILIAGGGINSDINFGVFIPPSTNVSYLNVTGIPYAGAGGGWAQDIADFVFDPANNDMYSIYGSLIGTPSIGNKIYKNTAPYSSASIAWTVPSGYTTVREAANRPYLAATGLVDNSANMLWVNTSYLYYWDGKNLKAFSKATGAGVGTPLVTSNTAFMQGGIIADECNNIFVGEANGLVKVYHFDGSTFSDAPADITIPGFSGKAVYDLAYDESRKLLYASGDGFVASLDVSAYCPNSIYTINTTPDCTTGSVTATVTPAAPPGSNITYALYTGATQIGTNTTGVFNGLSPNITYTIIATINFACSGVQTSTTFTIPAPTISTVIVNTTCGNSSGSITVNASGGTGSYTYSIDGVSFQTGNSFTNLAAGVYTVTVKDGNGCTNIKVVTITNTNGPGLSFTQTNAACGNNTGTVTATASGGTLPYQYSIDGGGTYQSNNFFTGLTAGQYVLVVRDSNSCTNSAVVTISSGSASPTIMAVPASATCGQNNGTITAFGSGGTAPLQYSVNGNTFQLSNVFSSLTPGTYTVTVKDANGCTQTTTATINNSSAPVVSTAVTPATCGNVNGTITANGSGGIAPYQYSIDGVFFQSSNVFTGLAPGSYTITIKDNTGCSSIATAVVSSTNGPTVTANTVASSCASNTGSIVATGTGGSAPYQYSIDGISFQSSGLFTGLAPGSYIVYISDLAGCIGATTATVNATAGPSLSVSSTASACNVSNGTITANGSGGTAPLQYSLDGITYQLSNSFTGLPTGSYTVYVKDANGCIKTADIIVADASGLTLSVSTITSSCSSNNGVITATASGVATPLTYSINGSIYQASNIFNGLAAGTYTVYVKDANGCIITQIADVLATAGPSLTVTPTDATCSGANGMIVASGSGGVDPLTYSINGITYQSSGTFLNVSAGTYTVTVKDASGCTASEIVVINSNGTGSGITSFTVTVKDAYMCNGDLGKITNPKVNGSTCGSCTYSLNGGPFIPNATQLFTGLTPGPYTVTVMDANGCTKTILVTVGNAAPSTATSVATGTACNTSNGSITITGVGPNTPYHASITGISGPWVTFDPNYTFTGLAPGTYSIILSDDASFDIGPPIDPGGCLDTIEVTVPSIGGPSITTSIVNGSCQQDNGSITINVTGGTAPYNYSIDGISFFSTNTFFNLGPGAYTITVEDDAGCSNIAHVTLGSTPKPTITAATIDASCDLDNGSIVAAASGGTAPLQYSIDGTNFQAGNTFNNLAPGVYDVFVKDAGNCFDMTTVVLSAITRVNVTAFSVPATCGNSNGLIIANGSLGTGPYTYSIDSIAFQSSNVFTGLSAGFYTVYIRDGRGCVNTTGVSVTNNLAPSLNASATAASCGNPNGSITATAGGGVAPLQYSIDGITYQVSNIFNGLLPGTYTVYVKDFNGCINTKPVLVSNINGPQTLTAVIVDEACGTGDGSITATATGGSAPLQYSIDGINYQPSPVFNNVAAGFYTLSVKDNRTCIKTLDVIVMNLAGPTLTASASAATCGLSDGSITVTATGGTGTLLYSIDGINFQTENIFLYLPDGTYTVTVVDTRGCSNTTTATIGSITPPFTGTLAAVVGGPQASKAEVVAVTGTQYFDPLCLLIDKVTPSGVSPVSGMINNHVIIDATVQYINGTMPYVQRHFDIEPDIAPVTSTATITLYFKDEEFVEFNNNRMGYLPLPTVATGGNTDTAIANARITQYHGVPIAPHDQGNPAPGFYTDTSETYAPSSVHWDSIYNYWEVSFPITGFSGFYLHTIIVGFLPVDIQYFKGRRSGSEHILNWLISCHNASAGSMLTLERSNDNMHFSGIYSIAINETACQLPFEYTDAAPLSGRNYYRLKIINTDGRTIYSNIVLLNNDNEALDLISILPNPVTGNSYKLQVNSTESSLLNIRVMDLQGRILEERSTFVNTGINNIDMSARTLASGTYTVVVNTNKGRSRVLRFIRK